MTPAARVPVDSYGVGSSLIRGSNDFTADVVINNGRPTAKVGREFRPNPGRGVVKVVIPQDGEPRSAGVQPAEDRGDRLIPEPWDQHGLDELLDVLVLDLAEADRGEVGDLPDHPAGVHRLAGPGHHPVRDPGSESGQ